MKISGYRILGVLIMLLIIYLLCYLTWFIWQQEDTMVRVCYMFYFALIPLMEGLNENYPYLFKPFKTFFNYIHNILKKEYKL